MPPGRRWNLTRAAGRIAQRLEADRLGRVRRGLPGRRAGWAAEGSDGLARARCQGTPGFASGGRSWPRLAFGLPSPCSTVSVDLEARNTVTDNGLRKRLAFGRPWLTRAGHGETTVPHH